LDSYEQANQLRTTSIHTYIRAHRQASVTKEVRGFRITSILKIS